MTRKALITLTHLSKTYRFGLVDDSTYTLHIDGEAVGVMHMAGVWAAHPMTVIIPAVVLADFHREIQD